MDLAKVHLIKDSREKIAVGVLIVPAIALRNLQHSMTTLQYLWGLQLAHPLVDDDTFNISFLIGTDKY